jgi:hypothetical protein
VAARPDGLTVKQLKAIEALVEGSGPAEIERDLKIKRRTLWAWRHEHMPFMAELRRRQGLVLAASQGTLRVATEKAVEVLMEVAGSRIAADSARVAAAGKILDTAHRHIELAAVQEQMDEIQAALREERSEDDDLASVQ